MSEDAAKRFTRSKDVYESTQDYVCYLGLERDTGVQVFWYEFVNEGMSGAAQEAKFRRLVEAKQIVSSSLLKILEVFREEVPPRFLVITEATQAPSICDYLQTIESAPTLRALLKWFRLLCLGVQALHEAKVAHCGITPFCTFLKTTTGTLKLRLPLIELSGRLRSGSSLDLDAYKAPELLSGNVSTAADIWSLGIILLELVTGKPAFSEMKTPYDLVLALRRHQVPSSLANVEVGELNKLIRWCLQSAEQRPTIEDLLEHELLNPQNSKDVQSSQVRTTSPMEKSIQILVGTGNESGTPPL
jgi:serine/threonine protein kinase